MTGMPAIKSQEATCLKPFYYVRDRLTVANNLVIYSFEQGPARLDIPEGLRNKVACKSPRIRFYAQKIQADGLLARHRGRPSTPQVLM